MGEPLQAQGLTAEYKEAEVRNEEIKITFSHVPKFVSLSMYYSASGYNYGYSVNIYYSKQTTTYHYADPNSKKRLYRCNILWQNNDHRPFTREKHGLCSSVLLNRNEVIA